MIDHDLLRDHVADRWKLHEVTLVGRGLEFTVFRAVAPDGSPVALRLAERRFDSNVNDPTVDTRTLLVQEFRITRHLADKGLPVAEPIELALAEDDAIPDMLVSRYVVDDGSRLDPYLLGATLAWLHLLPPPRLALVAAEGTDPLRALAARIRRRCAELGRLVASHPGRPGSPGRCEFGRLTEYARYPENDLDLPAIRAGYARTAPLPPDDTPTALACRLDAALMLALVFLSEAPDPQRGPTAEDHARSLAERFAAGR